MEYYYDGAWRQYDELHDQYGITLAATTPITVYTEELEELNGWEDLTEAWIVQNTRWYPLDELPYYRKTDNQTQFYLIGQLLSLDEYTRWDSSLYNYENHLYSQQFLHDRCGITVTPSQIYYAKNNVIKCWYNPDENQYWDVDTVQWYPDPPSYEDSPIDASDINRIGAMGLFAFTSDSINSIHYGTIVNASQLQPISMNFPNSGEFNYTKVLTETPITGRWRLLSAIAKSSDTEPCIVLAIKVSEQLGTSLGSSHTNSNSNNQITGNFVETIEYNL